MRFDGDIIIIDPCSVVKSNSDWHNCEFGANMSALGFTDFVYADAGSDSRIRIIDTDRRETIGTVCTDSCVFAVLLFDEVMRYNPGFSEYIRYPENSVIIRSFSGGIVFEENSFTGTGNVNFRSEAVVK